MILRSLSLVFGLVLICVVVFLGLRATQESTLVVWFGIAAAILTPTAFALIGYAIAQPRYQTIEKLSKIPEIETLIATARSHEERIALLEQQRKQLVQIIEYEAQAQSLASLRKSIETRAIELLEELEDIEKEEMLLNGKISLSPLSGDISRLRDRLTAHRRGDFVFAIGDTNIVIPRAVLEASFLGLYFNIVFSLATITRRIFTRKAPAHPDGR